MIRSMLTTSRFGTVVRRTAAQAVGSVRTLNVLEHISMEIMRSHGIKTPECMIANTPEEAEEIFINGLNKRKLSVFST